MRHLGKKGYRIVCIGTSFGGIKAVTATLSTLPKDFPLPILVVQHVAADQDHTIVDYINEHLSLTVKLAQDKEPLLPGYVYYAPPNYHLLVEEEETLSLSIDEKVNYSRPSIDVLFESVADSFAAKAIGIILTGANDDGAKGMKQIKMNGGLTIVQDPETAESPIMPNETIRMINVDYVLSLKEIRKLLKKLVEK